jgi:hypothetical protein
LNLGAKWEKRKARKESKEKCSKENEEDQNNVKKKNKETSNNDKGKPIDKKGKQSDEKQKRKLRKHKQRQNHKWPERWETVYIQTQNYRRRMSHHDQPLAASIALHKT